MGGVTILDEGFKEEFARLTTFSSVIENPDRVMTEGDANRLSEAWKAVSESKNRRLHKIIFLLPAGRFFFSKVDEVLVKVVKDASNLAALRKLRSAADSVTIFKPRGGDSRGPLVLDNKAPMRQFCMGYLALEVKLPDLKDDAEIRSMMQACSQRLDENAAQLKKHLDERFSYPVHDAVSSMGLALGVNVKGDSGMQRLTAEEKKTQAVDFLNKAVDAFACARFWAPVAPRRSMNGSPG